MCVPVAADKRMKRVCIEWNKVAVAAVVAVTIAVVTNVNVWQVESSQLIVCLRLKWCARVCVRVCVLARIKVCTYLHCLFGCVCVEQKLGARAQNRINIPLALAFLLSLILDLHTNTVYLFRCSLNEDFPPNRYERTANDRKKKTKKKKTKFIRLNSARIVMAQLHNCDLDEIWLF